MDGLGDALFQLNVVRELWLKPHLHQASLAKDRVDREYSSRHPLAVDRFSG
jgi:hypothetical protein